MSFYIGVAKCCGNVTAALVDDEKTTRREVGNFAADLVARGRELKHVETLEGLRIARCRCDSRVEQRSARVAHNHEVEGSNPSSASSSCKHEHGSGIMDTNGNGEFTCHDCGDVLVLGRGFQPQQLVTLRPDEAENWECPRCNSLTSTMLTRCYVCATPRGAV